MPTQSVNILPHGGQALYFENFLSSQEGNHWIETISQKCLFEQHYVKVFGQTHPQPRLTSWMAEEGLSYTYSGLKLQGLGFPQWILPLKHRIEDASDHFFNSILFNYYRNGSDRMGLHRDNEPELGPHPTIASLNLGQDRPFVFRPYQREKKPMKKKSPVKILLQHGSLLLMSGRCQEDWAHELPRALSHPGERYNLTFRMIQVS